MRFLFDEFRIVVEPGGAVAFASLLFNAPESFKGKNVAVIISGGNVDPMIFSHAIM
jgi:threonine dehydratase